MKKLVKILAAIVVSLFLVVPAFAVPILDFGTGGAAPGGTITDLGGGDYAGSGIGLDDLLALGTGADGLYDLSGAFVGGSATGGTAAVLTFSTVTNIFTIVGGVPSFAIPGGTVLLSGTITDFHIDSQTATGIQLGASGFDTKDPALLAALGIIGPDFTFAGFTIGANSAGGGSPYTVISTDFTNTQVPEPISLILLGCGLAGVGLYRRMRKPRG